MHTTHCISRLLGGSASVHAGIPHPSPWAWAWRHPPVWAWRHPPGCGPGDTPRPDPSTSPPGCGSGDLQCMLGYHPPPLWTEFLTQVLKILPCSNFVAGGNNFHFSFELDVRPTHNEIFSWRTYDFKFDCDSLPQLRMKTFHGVLGLQIWVGQFNSFQKWKLLIENFGFKLQLGGLPQSPENEKFSGRTSNLNWMISPSPKWTLLMENLYFKFECTRKCNFS